MNEADAINPLCVALDSPEYSVVERLAFVTEPHVGLFKIGLMAFAANGPGIVRTLVRMRPVFLDLKLHDIPIQVEGAVRAAARLGTSYVTVHAAGGPEMITAAVAGAAGDATVLAVTVLTSLDDRVLELTGVNDSTTSHVLRLAELALRAGAPGLVCSPLEVPALRSQFGAADDGGPLLVVPGIRPTGVDSGDQRRTMTPQQAVEAGADVIVVGRPITAALDPAAAARTIRAQIAR